MDIPQPIRLVSSYDSRTTYDPTNGSTEMVTSEEFSRAIDEIPVILAHGLLSRYGHGDVITDQGEAQPSLLITVYFSSKVADASPEHPNGLIAPMGGVIFTDIGIIREMVSGLIGYLTQVEENEELREKFEEIMKMEGFHGDTGS